MSEFSQLTAQLWSQLWYVPGELTMRPKVRGALQDASAGGAGEDVQ